MGLFTSTRMVGEQSSPTAAYESMAEINRICNDMTLSQPALEALFELPELAAQFDVVNTAPSVAMLDFVAKQKLASMGVECQGVAQEGVIESVKNAAVGAWKWLMSMLTKIKNWVLSFFVKKPSEQAKAVVDSAIARVDEKIKTAEQKAPPISAAERVAQHYRDNPGDPKAINSKGTPVRISPENLRTIRKALVLLGRNEAGFRKIDAQLDQAKRSLADSERTLSKMRDEPNNHKAPVLELYSRYLRGLSNTLHLYAELQRQYKATIEFVESAHQDAPDFQQMANKLNDHLDVVLKATQEIDHVACAAVVSGLVLKEFDEALVDTAAVEHARGVMEKMLERNKIADEAMKNLALKIAKFRDDYYN